MPGMDNILRFERGERKQQPVPDPDLHARFSRIDELEDVLDLMTDNELETRDDVSALIQRLEQEVAELESDGSDS